MILLDTNALIWIEQGHPRVRQFLRQAQRLHISPISLLELQFLAEAGRIRLHGSLQAIADDDRWTVDEPSAAALCVEAATLSWTRDPFDRLIVAHARLRRWRLATADANLIERLGPTRIFEL